MRVNVGIVPQGDSCYVPLFSGRPRAQMGPAWLHFSLFGYTMLQSRQVAAVEEVPMRRVPRVVLALFLGFFVASAPAFQQALKAARAAKSHEEAVTAASPLANLARVDQGTMARLAGGLAQTPAPANSAAPAPCKKSNYWCEPLRKVIADRDNGFVNLRGKVKKSDSQGRPLVFRATVELPGAECDIYGLATYECEFVTKFDCGGPWNPMTRLGQDFRQYDIYVQGAIPTGWHSDRGWILRDSRPDTRDRPFRGMAWGPESGMAALILGVLHSEEEAERCSYTPYLVVVSRSSQQ